jgi:hypothetical protein
VNVSSAVEPGDLNVSGNSEAQELDSLGRPTGVEVEALAQWGRAPEPVDAEDINDPFDPDKIDVATRTPTVDLLLSRIRNGQIDLEPDFQRNRGIWSPRAKSRLIESLLLRIPLPTLYAAEAEDESWAIVDGVQRLTTITEFVEPASLGSEPLVLRDLEYLERYNGLQFADLPVRLQTRLRESELVVHLIRRGTLEQVKFNIFARINTGGLPLSAQELRHALIAGPARNYLREWAGSHPFIIATGESVRSERMADREMVLRFVAFHLADPFDYRVPDFDEFLRKAMGSLNQLNAAEVDALERAFSITLTTAFTIFGKHAFRKRSLEDRDKRNPINKALFETITVSLASFSDEQRAALCMRAKEIEQRFLELMHDYSFLSAISVGTGQVARVRYRFRVVHNLFAGVLND